MISGKRGMSGKTSFMSSSGLGLPSSFSSSWLRLAQSCCEFSQRTLDIISLVINKFTRNLIKIQTLLKASFQFIFQLVAWSPPWLPSSGRRIPPPNIRSTLHLLVQPAVELHRKLGRSGVREWNLKGTRYPWCKPVVASDGRQRSPTPGTNSKCNRQRTWGRTW